MKKGFSLVELLVVISIIAILAALLLVNYKSGQKQLALNRAASKLAQDIRRAQEMAMAAEEVGENVPKGGYGIYFRKQPSPQRSYIFFADKDINNKCDFGNESINEIEFEGGGIKIKDLGGNHLNVIFRPPDPVTLFTDADGNILDYSGISIEISLIEDETKSKIIRVNKAGLIDVQ